MRWLELYERLVELRRRYERGGPGWNTLTEAVRLASVEGQQACDGDWDRWNALLEGAGLV